MCRCGAVAVGAVGAGDPLALLYAGCLGEEMQRPQLTENFKKYNGIL